MIFEISKLPGENDNCLLFKHLNMYFNLAIISPEYIQEPYKRTNLVLISSITWTVLLNILMLTTPRSMFPQPALGLTFPTLVTRIHQSP